MAKFVFVSLGEKNDTNKEGQDSNVLKKGSSFGINEKPSEELFPTHCLCPKNTLIPFIEVLCSHSALRFSNDYISRRCGETLGNQTIVGCSEQLRQAMVGREQPV